MNLEPIRIQPYSDEPPEILKQINQACLQPLGLENLFSVSDLDDVPAFYAEKGGIFFTIKHHQEIIGFGAIDNLYEGIIGSLTRLRVLPEHQGKGIGSQLIGELISQARLAGYQRLFLDTSTLQNTASLYQKFGFTEFFRRTGPAGVTDVFYEMKLS